MWTLVWRSTHEGAATSLARRMGDALAIRASIDRYRSRPPCQQPFFRDLFSFAHQLTTQTLSLLTSHIGTDKFAESGAHLSLQSFANVNLGPIAEASYDLAAHSTSSSWVDFHLHTRLPSVSVCTDAMVNGKQHT